MAEEDVLKTIVADLVDSSSDSSDDDEDILDLIEQESDLEESVMLDFFEIFECQKRNSIPNYLNKIVPLYTDEEFKQHFRISKELYLNLSAKFAESTNYASFRADKRLPPNTYLAVFLWFAGHEACSFRDLSDRFNLALSTVSRIINKTTMFISSLSPDVITWPNDVQKQQPAIYFENRCGFPKTIGCIDGTHIVIDPPRACKDDYIDRKGNVTVTMQAVCNESRKFINIFVGFPGSSHDSWVYKNSPLYQNFATLCEDYYLLRDSAYPCTQYLLTPYKDNGHLTKAQKNFNIKLSSGRVCIEHSFGMLKQRFRQLYYCKLRGMKKLCHFIRACCVLHNLANANDLEFNDTEDEAKSCENEQPGTSRGNHVRDEICMALQTRL